MQLKSVCVGLINGRIKMAIFTARCIEFPLPMRARPANGTDAAITYAGASVTVYRAFSIGPEFERPLARVEVEEIAGRRTERQPSVLQSAGCCRLLSSASDLAFLAAGPDRSKKKTQERRCGL